MSRDRASIGCGIAALAAYGGALASLVMGYRHAADHACPGGASAPDAFWPLLILGAALAVVGFRLRPRRRDTRGLLSATDAFAFVAVIGVLVAAIATVFGYEVAYACWE
jgi:hypothetical protein